MDHRLIIVSNRLPVCVHKEQDTLSLSRSNGGLATALASLFSQDTSLWIGWTGFRKHLSHSEIEKLAFPNNLLPVNLTHEEIIGYYDGFSNGILWPLAHGLPATANFDQKMWDETRAVTKKFADTIEQVIQDSDDIWIHDYHLILLPAELRKRGLENRIGFFLHTPFMPFEKARNLPHGRDLVKSLLTVDVLGLQTKRDVERFTQTSRQLLGTQAQQPVVKSFPIGVDFNSFDSTNDNPEIKKVATTLRENLGKKTIILSLSRLDYTKGILTQLHAYEGLIRELPEPQRVVYRLNVAPSRESVLEYRELRENIEQLANLINETYGTKTWQPVVFTYENMDLDTLAVWYQVADIQLNLPVADGMNLVAKEYVAARREAGVLIISSTMGAAAQLRAALIIPSENTVAATEALHRGLSMSLSEKSRRWGELRHNVENEQVFDWSQNFLSELTKKD